MNDLHNEWKTYEELTEKGKQHKNLKHIFRKHVKPKKQHEIARLGSLVKVVSKATEVQQIVDVGSGVGHLSRILAYAHDLKTVSIDAKENYVESARSFDEQLVKQLQKNARKQKLSKTDPETPDNFTDSPNGPFHLASYVDFNDKKKFIKELSTYFTGNIYESSSLGCILLIFLDEWGILGRPPFRI